MIDEFDMNILEQAGLLLANVDRSKNTEELKTDSAYTKYLNLINQTTDNKPAKKTSIIQSLLSILIKIINYIKLHPAILK